MNVELQLFSSVSDSKPVSIQNGEVKRQNGNYFSRMGGKIYVKNASNILLVDVDFKTIVYGNRQDEKEVAESVLPFDSVMTWQVGKMKYVINNPDIKKIEYKDEESEIYDKVELTINARTNLLSEICYYIKKINDKDSDEEDFTYSKIVVKYSGVKLNSLIPYSAFSIKEYVSEKHGVLAGNGKYVSYKVMDQSKFKMN
jgi:hypothetical protein